MIKIKKDKVVIKGTTEEIATEWSLLTNAILDSISKTTDEETAREVMKIAFKVSLREHKKQGK